MIESRFSNEYDFEQASHEVEQVVRDAGCFERGDFRFAEGISATNKINLEKLKGRPENLEVVIGHLLRHPAMRGADIILAVPDGAQDLFADTMSRELGIPWARLRKIPGERYGFEFTYMSERQTALAASHPRIIEDVVRTMGSINGVAELLDHTRQDIQSLGVWLRGEVRPEYTRRLNSYHHLVEQFVPLD